MTCKVCGRTAKHGDTFITTIAKLTRVECVECNPCRIEYLRRIRGDR